MMSALLNYHWNIRLDLIYNTNFIFTNCFKYKAFVWKSDQPRKFADKTSKSKESLLIEQLNDCGQNLSYDFRVFSLLLKIKWKKRWNEMVQPSLFYKFILCGSSIVKTNVHLHLSETFYGVFKFILN